MQSSKFGQDEQSWDCGYPTEVGCVIFNTAVLRDKYTPETYFEDKILNAVNNLRGFETDLQRTLHNMSYFQCTVTKGTKLRYRGRTYQLLHCLLRVKTVLLPRTHESISFLNFLKHNMFNCHDKVIEKNESLLNNHPDIAFNPEGFPINSSLGLRFLLHSLKIKLSGNDQCEEPFAAREDQRSCKGVSKLFCVPKPSINNHLVKGTFSRKAFLKNLEPEYWKFFGNELCYMCGVKKEQRGDCETWCIHLHCPSSDTNTPPSLINISKLAVLQASFLNKRASRFHPYFTNK